MQMFHTDSKLVLRRRDECLHNAPFPVERRIRKIQVVILPKNYYGKEKESEEDDKEGKEVFETSKVISVT